MTANPFAALLDGVPRYRHEHLGVMVQTKTDIGVWFFVDQVLAALAAAYPADLAEAGEIAEQLLREADGFSVRASDTITALLARLAAHEAQIAELNRMTEAPNLHVEWLKARAEAAETALAAERAKVAKLLEAAKALQADMLERARIGRDAIHGEEYRIVNAGRTAWADFCAAIAEAGR